MGVDTPQDKPATHVPAPANPAAAPVVRNSREAVAGRRVQHRRCSTGPQGPTLRANPFPEVTD
eukprot:CAMPEP_0185566958 /NCGR_PEP_ID=MMETSP0434-20130131/364_1 /TAXON_ID=626734 ORGANISM="Favella taraikaensis, Strain Fe Narragansett Bay" /NCGR_SAMPLE_ID=MMETSP0434 /ASSEMBLY_ACC=CAM_ASM_000379 /LENGTH=62 /DNA_ID=CAMNT_0028181033 /DNA_START=63 /DNA_END=248 /DNA_ORIENTATION=+